MDATLTKRSLAHALHDALTRDAGQPGQEALILVGPGGEQRATRGEVDAHARYTAHRLIAGGIQPGDLLLILLDHTYEAIPMFLGALYMGAVPMILPYFAAQTAPAQQTERLAGLVHFFQPKALLTLPRLQNEIDALGVPVSSLAWDFQSDEAASPPEVALCTRADEDLAYLQFTSGTTGQPKAVMVSHRALLEAFQVGAERFKLTADDSCVLAAPLSHASGLAGAGLHMIWLGIRSVILAPSYWAQKPSSLLHAIHEYRGTYTILTNTGLNLTLLRVQPEEIAGVELDSLRLLVVGSEMISPQTLERFAQRFAAFGFKSDAFKTAYAASEVYIAFQSADLHWRAEMVSANALITDKEARPVAPEIPDARVIACCGTPLSGVTIQIQDEEGNILADRKLGQIVVKSSTLFSGYWQRPDLTDAVLKEGWYYTGDLGYLANGELFVVGRLKDLIIVGGRNLLPDAVEEQALVAGRGALRGAVAFGVRDEVVGTEQPVVVCEPSAPQDEETRNQTAQAIRQRVHQLLDVTLADVRFVESGWILRAGGKLARGANRDKYLAEYRPAASPEQATEPVSPLEQVTAIFEEILGHKPVGVDDNFFDLGGDSIAALKMLLRVEKHFGHSVPSEFFQKPTVAHLVKLLDSHSEQRPEAGGNGTATRIEAPPAPLTVLQRAGRVAKSPQRIPKQLRWRIENQAFQSSYSNGMRRLAAWCGNSWVQQALYPQEVSLVRQFCTSLGVLAPMTGEEIQRSLMGNILMQRLSQFIRSADTQIALRELQTSSLPLVRDLGQALAATESEMGERIFDVHGFENLESSVRPGQGIMAITYHATTMHAGMGTLLKQRSDHYWMGSSSYRDIFRTLYGSDPKEGAQFVPVVRAQATQTAHNVLMAGGIVGISVDTMHHSSPVHFVIGDRVYPMRTGFAELALATGAAVIPTYTVLQTDGRLSEHILPGLNMGDAGWSHTARVEHLAHQAGAFLEQAWRQAPSTLGWVYMERHLKAPKAEKGALVQPVTG